MVLGWHTWECNIWFWVQPHYTAILHMLNHIKVLQSKSWTKNQMFYSNVSQPMSHWQWPNDTAQYSVKVHYRHPRYPPYNRSRIQNLWCLTRVRLARSTIPEIMRWLFKKFWKLFFKQEFFILEVTNFEKSKLSSASDGISASIFFSLPSTWLSRLFQVSFQSSNEFTMRHVIWKF